MFKLYVSLLLLCLACVVFKLYVSLLPLCLSRACRLKKKAQHEANKIKLYGLGEEHKFLLQQLQDCRTLIHNKVPITHSSAGMPDPHHNKVPITHSIAGMPNPHTQQGTYYALHCTILPIRYLLRIPLQYIYCTLPIRYLLRIPLQYIYCTLPIRYLQRIPLLYITNKVPTTHSTAVHYQ